MASPNLNNPIYQTSPTCNPLTNSIITLLSSLLSDPEITRAIKSFSPMKAPGPDGIQPIFFQRYWEIVKSKVMKFYHNTFLTSTMDPSVNTTFLCLIPKCPNAISIKNYRPIGLHNTLYKLIIKIIVFRMKPLFHKIIGPSQASFFQNRRASDHAIIVQEFITHFKKIKGKQGSMILKIDLEKIFNRLEWSFIRDTLHFFSFPQPLISLIMSCVSTTTIFILINGSVFQQFKPSRGIRQGDPLSPYLFILCMERLSRIIDLKVSDKEWQPISISLHGPSISHLFFVDNLTLLSKANPQACLAINHGLNNFYVKSGQ